MMRGIAKFILVVFIAVCTAAGIAAVIRQGEIKIPSEYGRITEGFDGGGDKLVIHVQDAHTNYEAQKNAAGMLEDLINKYGVYLILVEGGSRDVSLNYYRDQYPLEERKKMAEESLKKGEIAGEEYLNIASDYPIKLQGIEDRALYDQNMEAYLEIDKQKDSALLFTKLLSEVISNLKDKLYNKALSELDKKRIEFKEERMPLNDYVQYLNELAKPQSAVGKNWFAKIWEKILVFLSKIGLIKYTPPPKIDLSLYPDYQALVNSIELEKTIDFAVVEKERADAIELLSKKIDQNSLNELLTKSVEFKSGKLSQGQYHNYLKDMMAKANLDIKEYPNLERYVRYITIYEKIDSAMLFKELKAVEGAVSDALAANDSQKQLLRIAKDLELLTEFINLKLSPDDFDYYQKNEGKFDISAWVRFLNEQLSKYNLTQRVPEDTKIIANITPSLNSFYTIARKRDDVFLNNTRKYMDAEGVNIAVLIAGGFHTPSLMKLFRDNKISYVVVAPKVVRATDENLYHKILTEGWAPAKQK